MGGVEPEVAFADWITFVGVVGIAVVGEIRWVGADDCRWVIGNSDPAVNRVDVNQAGGAVPPEVADVDGVAVVVVGWWGGARFDDDGRTTACSSFACCTDAAARSGVLGW